MDKLYAPWRDSYVTGIHKGKRKNKIDPNECVFCKLIEEKKDTKNFILKRFKNCFVMLNKFPYNAGHLMIIPIKHINTLDKLTPAARQEIMETINQTTTVLQKALECDGLNIGINIGKASGAGIPGHLHIHVLPRWEGDTNWLPLLAETKQISVDLNQLYKVLKPVFAKIK